ncbi:MAG: bifunctional phosphoribosylaminoimidazolecarboxamide formyltransferase/IMP cyclohydrolase PurH [Bacteroidota bacterium]|jgi:phosphoribosylaminoimidazolecarboxamide formyltransferase/IMP cyclohydrolase
MQKKIQSALISVFYKDGLEPLVEQLKKHQVKIYSTGGTQTFLESLGATVTPVEALTNYPAILGGRVKTLHPVVFGGILGKRNDETHRSEMQQYSIPEIDLVIVDLYPFEETVASTNDEKSIIEKIDIGGPSMIRAAAKNHQDLTVIAAKNDYAPLAQLLEAQDGSLTLDQRRSFAAKAFEVVAHYDVAIAHYFNPTGGNEFFQAQPFPQPLRYGENPHQPAIFYGDLNALFEKLNGKELSYNNLVDVDAALQLIREFPHELNGEYTFGIIKHTNVCGIAQRPTVLAAWQDALAGDPESAFGGILICNGIIDAPTASAIQDIFFEVLLAPGFTTEALEILRTKKNRILLAIRALPKVGQQSRSLLNGVLIQTVDEGNFSEWKEAGGRATTDVEKDNLIFANLVCKHLKSNAIALVKNRQLIGKGCGQTSRIDSLRQAIEKSKQFQFDLQGAVMASDAFFPFNDCVQLGHQAGIEAYIQPGGSVRDNDSIEYCQQHKLAMVITGQRHFKH